MPHQLARRRRLTKLISEFSALGEGLGGIARLFFEDAQRMPFKIGCTFFWYRDIFFVVSRWPESPFWYRDLFFGIEILHSLGQHLDHLLPGINPCKFFGPRHPAKSKSKISRCRKEDRKISIPQKRRFDTN